MKVIVSKTAVELGEKVAAETARVLNETLAKQDTARLLLSTGASQFTTFAALLKESVDWSRVEIFHLDEYIGIDKTHNASFQKYLHDRFISKLDPQPKAMNYVDPSIGVEEIMEKLSAILAEAPIDVGLIGIGENGHIAFNDPPADFEKEDCYHVVTLDHACRNQQLGEGWFATLDDVPRQAISMTVKQIMKCRTILSAVPYAVKATAVRNTLTQEVNNMVPATMLKTHPDATLFIDEESASLTDAAYLK